jgi:hypothetical protein
LLALVALGFIVYRFKPYTPGSDFGYYMGMVGGILMLLLLLYPLRKHVRPFHVLGATRHWFRLHMVLGILGPTLVLFHSTFEIGSLNAGVALFCMVLVAGSGIIGRFIYRRIHHGLYGRRASLEERQTALGLRDQDMKSKFHFAPRVEERLKKFETEALALGKDGLAHLWRFTTLGFRSHLTAWHCLREIKRLLKRQAHERGWEQDKLHARVATANRYLDEFLSAVRDAAQFTTYERLFRLWHVAHVPFVWMLAISGVVHVVAVHMY